MRWEDEHYVRVYTRDTIEWDMLGWEARALFLFLLRKVDRAGILELGKHGVRGLASMLRMPLEVVDRALAELLEDGCTVQRGASLVIPNYIEAQEAKSSDRQRKREQRLRARDRKRMADEEPVTSTDADRDSVTPRDQTGQSVTPCDEPSESVTDSHDRSHDVTRGHSEQSRAEPSKTDPAVAEAGGSREAHASAEPPQHQPQSPGPGQRMLAEMRRHRTLDTVVSTEFGRELADRIARKKIPVEWAIEAIADVAVDAAAVGLNTEALANKVRRYVDNAREPRPPRTDKAGPVPTSVRPRGAYEVQNNGEFAEIERRQREFQAAAEEAQRRGDVSEI